MTVGAGEEFMSAVQSKAAALKVIEADVRPQRRAVAAGALGAVSTLVDIIGRMTASTAAVECGHRLT